MRNDCKSKFAKGRTGSKAIQTVSRLTTTALLLGFAGAASAITTYQVSVTNTTGGNVNDIHLTFLNTGNSIANRVVLNPGGGVILASQGNQFYASFNNLANNGVFKGTFDANFANVAFDAGDWTLNGAIAGPIPRSAVKLEVVPEPGSMTAFALGALSLLRRRKSLN